MAAMATISAVWANLMSLLCRFWYSWRAQLEDLQEFELAAIDLPGCNTSQKLPSTASYVTGSICNIIAAALTAIGRESCILVGMLLAQIAMT
jgi:pimeloyl-ACP methyl ester carboxylesterase